MLPYPQLNLFTLSNSRLGGSWPEWSSSQTMPLHPHLNLFALSSLRLEDLWTRRSARLAPNTRSRDRYWPRAPNLSAHLSSPYSLFPEAHAYRSILTSTWPIVGVQSTHTNPEIPALDRIHYPLDLHLNRILCLYHTPFIYHPLLEGGKTFST